MGPLLFVVVLAGIITFISSRFLPEDSPYADGWAGALSVIFPGAGHVYKGYVGTGMLLMIDVGVYFWDFALGMVLHVFVIAHSIKVELPDRAIREPELARCSVCDREYPEDEMKTHAGKLWCARDYRAALATG